MFDNPHKCLVRAKRLYPHAKLFQYTRPDDACMDMFTLEPVILDPFTTAVIRTGIALEIPEGYEGIVRGRSGWESKGLQVFVGTIEASYRGDVGIIAYNSTDHAIEIPEQSRIAQFTVKPVVHIRLAEEVELTQTDRGAKGYGSSGF